MRVVVVAEYYPSPADPVLGVWAHRQALAVRDLGVDVRVVALQRAVPPERALAALVSRKPDLRPLRTWHTDRLATPPRMELDGIPVEYVPLVAPPRRVSYGSWGLWAARAVRKSLSRLAEQQPFDLIHAHYAVPGGQAAHRANTGRPVVVSVHGGDLLATPQRSRYARRAVAESLRKAALVLCNSRFSQRLCTELAGTQIDSEVLHLGTDLPELAEVGDKRDRPTVVTVAHLIPRKRHADVIEAIAGLPDVNYLVIGTGPELEGLQGVAARFGVGDRVEFARQLDHERAMEEASRCHLFVMPSIDEAFGVAYIEAMAARLPAIGVRGEGGPEEIAALGEGMLLVPAKDPETLKQTIANTLADRSAYEQLAAAARETVERNFTWEQCGRQTVAAFESVLARPGPA